MPTLHKFAIIAGSMLLGVHLRRMLGLERIERDGFFKTHGIYEDYTMEDFERELQALNELGF